MPTLTLENVRCFERLELSFDADVTVLIGENGAGKTTIAEALASLAWGDEEGLDEFPLRRGASSGAVTLTDTDATWRWGSSGTRERMPKVRWLLGYGRYRRVWVRPKRTAKETIALGDLQERHLRAPVHEDLDGALLGRRTRTLVEPDGELFDKVEQLLRYVGGRREVDPAMAAAWSRLERCVEALGQGLRGPRFVDSDSGDRVVFERRGVDLALRELSDGFQSILVVLFDVALRLSLRPPEPGTRPLVLVDEIDLHLHPRWQRTVVDQLVRLFPEVQWVLTTHSGAVVQGAIDAGHAVWVLGARDGKGEVRKLGGRAVRELAGAEIGSVLHDKRTFSAGSRYSRGWEDKEREAAQLRRLVARDADTPADRKKLKRLLNELTERLDREDRRRGGDGVLVELARANEALLDKLERRVTAGDA